MINVRADILKELRIIFLNYDNIEKVKIFGSRVTDNYRENSDIDLAILGEISEPERIEIKISINDIKTLYSFDVIFVDQDTNGLIFDEIIRKGVDIYIKEIFSRKDIRYNELKKAYEKLEEVVKSKDKYDNNLEQILIDSTIQRYEFTFELMWKVIKDYIENEGFDDNLASPKTTLKIAFKNGIINEEKIFSNMLEDRNITTHLYDQKSSKEIYNRICNIYSNKIKHILNFLEKNDYLKK